MANKNMRESLETEYLRMSLVTSELTPTQSKTNSFRFSKKLIGGVSVVLIIGCVIATVCISSPQAFQSEDSTKLLSLQGSTILSAESGTGELKFSELASFEDYDGDYPSHLSSDGKYFVYVSNSRDLKVRSLEDSSKLYDIPYQYGKIYDSRFYLSHDTKILAVVREERFLHLINLNTTLVTISYEHKYDIRSLVLTHDNKHAFLIQQNSVCLLNLETKTNVYEFRLRDHELTIDATLSEDHQYILVKNEEELRVWNTSTKERVLLLYIEEIGCKIEHERFIKQNKYLVLIGEDEKVRVLDFLREREVFKRHVTLGWVSDIVYNDEYLALSGDGGFVLYNLNDWEEVENLNSSINYSMSLSRDGRYLVLALTDGTVTVFDLKNEITYNSSAFVGTNYGVISTRMKDDGTIIVFVMDEDSTPKLFSYNLKI